MRCPICKREIDETEKKRPAGLSPFCSERCKLIDLGRWLSGKYQIPIAGEEEKEDPPHSDDLIDS